MGSNCEYFFSSARANRLADTPSRFRSISVLDAFAPSPSQAFVEHYYKTFDAPGGRAQLGALYQDSSMLTWEGQKMQGTQNIVQKLSSLPFQSCTHHVSTMDCQPSGQSGGIIVSVTGQLLVSLRGGRVGGLLGCPRIVSNRDLRSTESESEPRDSRSLGASPLRFFATCEWIAH